MKESRDIKTLEDFFTSAILPDRIVLSPCEVISDPKKFISSHLGTINRHNGNPVYLPYFQRLEQVRAIIGEPAKPKRSKKVKV